MSQLSLVPLRVRTRPSRGQRREQPQAPYRTLVRVAALQHRTLMALIAISLALLTGWTYQVSGRLDDAHTTLAAAGCVDAWSPTCLGLLESAHEVWQTARMLQYALVGAPALLGLFLGAPLVAREFEQGTHLFAWSQSVSPARWLRGHSLYVCGVALVTGGACAGLGLWLHQAMTPALGPALGAFTPLAYNANGPVLAASCVLAVSLGIAAGALTRRTVPAMAATLLAYAATMTGLTWLRQFLLPVRTLVTNRGYDLAPDDWLLRDGVLLPDGHRVPYAQCVPGCPSAAPTYEDYHPASQLWPMQWTQAGLMLLLAAAALVLAHAALRRRR